MIGVTTYIYRVYIIVVKGTCIFARAKRLFFTVLVIEHRNSSKIHVLTLYLAEFFTILFLTSYEVIFILVEPFVLVDF